MRECLEGIVWVRNVCPEDLLDEFDLYEKLDGGRAGLVVVVLALRAFPFPSGFATETAFEETRGKSLPPVRAKPVA